MDNKTNRILLIGNDIELSTHFKDYLDGEGFLCTLARDGALGLAEAITGIYALTVIDTMVPIMDGFEVLRRLRHKSKLPVLMLTDRRDDIDRIVGLEMGADDIVTKSCSPRELVARIRAILRRIQYANAAEENKAITIGNMTLWPQRRLAAMDGSSLTLTSTEFTLLELLTRHAGAIVSKNVLAEAALGRPLSAYDRSIDVHICSIRHKLGDREDGLPWIQTIRGKGYQFINE